MPHRGDTVLPNTPFFSQLLRHAHYLQQPAIRDLNLNGLEKTHAELLSDVICLRNVLKQRLTPQDLDLLQTDEEEICIGVLAAGGYEFVVGMMAVLAIGAAAVPMTPALPLDEAMYFVQKSRQIAIVTSEKAVSLGRAIAERVNRDGQLSTASRPVQCMPVLPNLIDAVHVPPEGISISSDKYLSDNHAGLVIFTSGTTGQPKGAVLRRGYIHGASRNVVDLFKLTPQDALLHLLPVHHVTGLAINILPFLVAGSCIEFKSGSFDPSWVWQRWRDGYTGAAPPLTIFSGVPTICQRMMRHFESKIATSSTLEKDRYTKGANQFRIMVCGTSALPRPVSNFWEGIRHGKRILTRYGSTEIGAALRVRPEDVDVPDGSVGRVAAGVDLKLVDPETQLEGDEGEIFVKSPELFAKYLDDPKATLENFTSDGYFRTGDLARREGPWYFIVGRASQDIIKSGGYKISALDVEREILALPYCGEVIVVRVADEEFGERVAAVMTLREGQSLRHLTIDRLRQDLRQHMASYKLPTLLRIVEGELPKTASGKVLKKVLGPQLFPHPGWDQVDEVQVWRSRSSRL